MGKKPIEEIGTTDKEGGSAAPLPYEDVQLHPPHAGGRNTARKILFKRRPPSRERSPNGERATTMGKEDHLQGKKERQRRKSDQSLLVFSLKRDRCFSRVASLITLAGTMSGARDMRCDGYGAGRQRRDKRLRSWWRHEQ